MDASDSSSRPCIISPGPEDPSVLRLQNVHVSEHLWNGQKRNSLKTRKSQQIRAGSGRSVPPQIVQRLENAGFLGVASIEGMEIDRAFITALVDRWRPETHTFHMIPGECTITLQDIAIQLGLRIDGRPIIGDTGGNKYDIVEEALGIRPTTEDFNGHCLKMTWLDNHFGRVEDHLEPPEQLNRFTRAYMLRLIGGLMLADHSSSRVSVRYLPLLHNLDEVGQYSWGSAVLAHLYRELCNATDINRTEIGGLTPLIQLWAWERFPSIAPPCPTYDRDIQLPYACRWDVQALKGRQEKKVKHYRFKFDRLKQDEIIWQPYTEQLIAQLPAICREGRDLWRAVVPLICYNIVEWHQPDRVMRQFGMVQHIPHPPFQPDYLHDITLRGKTSDKWEQKYQSVLQVWMERYNWVYTNNPQHGLLSSNSEYMRWYTRITRRYITKGGAVAGKMRDAHERIYYLSTPEGRSSFSFDELADLAKTCLYLGRQQHHILESASDAPQPTQQVPMGEPKVQVDIPRSRKEGKGLQRRRIHIEAEQYTLPSLPQR